MIGPPPKGGKEVKRKDFEEQAVQRQC